MKKPHNKANKKPHKKANKKPHKKACPMKSGLKGHYMTAHKKNKIKNN